jgi:hypothetical protein
MVIRAANLQLCTAVWTGVTRNTMPLADMLRRLLDHLVGTHKDYRSTWRGLETWHGRDGVTARPQYVWKRTYPGRSIHTSCCSKTASSFRSRRGLGQTPV